MLERIEVETRSSNVTAAAASTSIADGVASRLRRSGYPTLANVSAEVHEGALVLLGRLSTYYLKQVAQTLAAQVDGVEEVINRIEVVNLGLCRTPAHGGTG
ncbi:MAG: BON domain-containing protein [Pseudomonadales bacterium]